MHTQVADAVMTHDMTMSSNTRTGPATMLAVTDVREPTEAMVGRVKMVASSAVTPQTGGRVSVRAVGLSGSAAPVMLRVSRPDSPTPGPGGCAGHSSICTATLHQPGVTLLPPSACAIGTWSQLVFAVGSLTAAPVTQALDPPAPEQALLQVWRC